MRKIITFLFIVISIWSLSACELGETNQMVINYQKINKKDGSKSEVKTIKTKEDVKKVVTIIKNVKWTSGPPKTVDYPDIEFWLNKKDSKIGNKYQCWFGQHTLVIFSPAQGRGNDLSKEKSDILSSIFKVK